MVAVHQCVQQTMQCPFGFQQRRKVGETKRRAQSSSSRISSEFWRNIFQNLINNYYTKFDKMCNVINKSNRITAWTWLNDISPRPQTLQHLMTLVNFMFYFIYLINKFLQHFMNLICYKQYKSQLQKLTMYTKYI